METRYNGTYKISRVISDSLVTIVAHRYGEQLWGKSRTRGIAKPCIIMDETPAKGSFMYRPIGNAGNRMLRISEAGMYLLKSEIQRNNKIPTFEFIQAKEYECSPTDINKTQ